MTVTVLEGDCRAILPTLPAESVHCVVTSPPYFGLRDYGTATWDGGDGECDHQENVSLRRDSPGGFHNSQGRGNQPSTVAVAKQYRDVCGKCGARRVDRQIGLEGSVEAYVAELVAVFREVRRILRDDGVMFLNLGDSYAGSWGNYGGHNRGKGGQRPIVNGSKAHQKAYDGLEAWRPATTNPGDGLKPKDLIGVPWRVAFALQQPNHYGPIAKEADRAWLAALIDGEGTIGIKKDAGRSNGGTGECQPGYSVFVSIGNQDRELLDRVVQITGYGSVGLKDRPFVDGRGVRSRRDYFGWWISANQAISVLRDVYPYLIAKRRQAILAYNLDVSNKAGRSLRGNGPLPASEQEKRAHLKAMCNACNQREHVDMPSWLLEPPSNFEQGWYLRSEIIWAKPNPMPESVRDRPTKAHEQIFLLTKSPRYFWDAEAVKEPNTQGTLERIASGPIQGIGAHPKNGAVRKDGNANDYTEASGRNVRSVWTIATAPFAEAHFATFPPALAERCVKAGTSEKGACPACGSPWARVVERETRYEAYSDGRSVADDGKWGREERANGRTSGNVGIKAGPVVETHTTGWQPSCTCDGYFIDVPYTEDDPTRTWRKFIGNARPPTPCVTLDPFAGAGTVALVSDRLGRDSIAVELSPEYAAMLRRRVTNDAPLFARVV